MFFKRKKKSDSLFALEINYPPNFQSRYGYGLPQAKHILNLFASKEAQQLEFLQTISSYKQQISSISHSLAEEDPEPRWDQPWFPPLDGMSMYAMVASKQPKKFIEIGSGNSTKFAARAVKDYSLDTEIISIDPQPRAEVDRICSRVIRQPVEEASGLDSIFAELEPNDVVFFDGSHRCLQNSDVTAFFIDYLPLIPDRVVVGIHDIFWPNDYPETWTGRYYNEQYVLAAYMLGMGSRFPLIFSCAYVGEKYPEKVKECLNEALSRHFEEQQRGIGGGCLWFQKESI